MPPSLVRALRGPGAGGCGPRAPVLRVTASDRDKGSNALVHYSICEWQRTGTVLDAQTGALDVVSPLDYEDDQGIYPTGSGTGRWPALSQASPA